MPISWVVATGGERTERGTPPDDHDSMLLEEDADMMSSLCRPKDPQDGLTRQDVTDTCRATLQKLKTAADKLGPTEEGQSDRPCHSAPPAYAYHRAEPLSPPPLPDCTWAAIIQLIDEVAEVPEGVSSSLRHCRRNTRSPLPGCQCGASS